MTTTPNLGLPYIDAAQAQKHVTHNEAIRGLDALVQTAVVTRTQSAPPATPANGACYILSAAGTGAWAAQAAATVAAWQDGLWVFYVPKVGWLAWIIDESVTVTWTGAVWQPLAVPSNLPLLGINATADATNKLSVNSPAILFNNTGNSVQLKLNKHGVADTASILYQDNFSGRAETGLTGDDGYHFKVSPDGSAWKEAIKLDATSGLATLFGDPVAALGAATKQYVDSHVSPTPPGGSSGQVQFNNGGAFGGFSANGDATIAATTGVVTITANAVTNAKAAQMAANSLKGNNTVAAANAVDLTAAQAKALLAIGTADVTGLGALATASAVNLTAQATGTLQAAQEPAHTGDVTNPAGSLALTIAANAVTNGKAAQMLANSFKGNNAATLANAVDLTAAQAKALLAIGTADVSGLAPSATTDTTNAANLSSGTLGAARLPALAGDVTSTAGSATTVLAANAVTNAKLAQLPANSLKGNNTGAVANAVDLTAAQAKALLAIGAADVSGLAASATTDTTNAANLSSGTLGAARLPALAGDVTSTAGSATTAIAANAVTNAKLAQMSANSLKGNNTGAVANSVDLTAAQAKALLAIGAADVSGLGALATASTVNLTSQATGALQAAQEPAHTGDVTNTAGSLALTIAANVVTNAKAAQMSANSIKGNNTGAVANAVDLTAAQTKALLAITNSDVSGLGALATLSTVNLSTQATGLTLAAQEPAHTGDVTNAAGSLALTIAANAVTNAKAAQMAANTLKGNSTGAAANATDLTVTQVLAMIAGGGVITSESFLSLTADQNGANVATAQTMFPGGGATQITLAANTTFDFEGRLEVDTTGATAHQLGILFAGTATLTSIDYTAWTTNSSTAATASAASATRATVATITNVTASAAAATQNSVWIRGTVRVNTAGTFIPQFQFSAAPGVAPVVRRNSQFRLWTKGTGTVLSAGAWS